MKLTRFLRIQVLAALLALTGTVIAADAGTTEVLKWKDGKKAAFFLGFDDSAPSQLVNVVPELEKHKIIGTFYLVTGNKLYEGLRAKWEAAAKSPYVVVANHTWTHKGVKNAEELGPELQKCNEVLYALHPERKQPYLLAFGKPGGVPWQVTDAEWNAGLEQNHLINRPPFAGPPINYKTREETLAVVDRALAQGARGYLVFHGVGGDWLVTPKEWFTALLDKLDKERDRLWITDTASCEKYILERNSAQAKVLETTAEKMRVSLTSKMDPTLYDEPLTLKTVMPVDWKGCVIVQGGTPVAVADGAVTYNAVPGGAEIVIQRTR